MEPRLSHANKPAEQEEKKVTTYVGNVAEDAKNSQHTGTDMN